jgi:hypothetical protein
LSIGLTGEYGDSVREGQAGGSPRRWQGSYQGGNKRDECTCVDVELVESRPNVDKQHLGPIALSGVATTFRDLELVQDIQVVVDL